MCATDSFEQMRVRQEGMRPAKAGQLVQRKAVLLLFFFLIVVQVARRAAVQVRAGGGVTTGAVGHLWNQHVRCLRAFRRLGVAAGARLGAMSAMTEPGML